MKKILIGTVALAGLAGYVVLKEISETLENKNLKRDLEKSDKENTDLDEVFGEKQTENQCNGTCGCQTNFDDFFRENKEDFILKTEESKKEEEIKLNEVPKDALEIKNIQEELAILSEIKQKNETLSALAGKKALEVKIGDLTIDERIAFLEEMLMNKVNAVDSPLKVDFAVEDVFKVYEKTLIPKGFIKLDFNNSISKAKESSEAILKELDRFKQAEVDLDLLFKKKAKK